MPHASVNGIQLEYEVSGKGEPLLLIMGLGAQLIHWPDSFVDRLVACGFQVIRFDNRDAGLSTKFNGEALPLWRSMLASVAKPLATSYYRLADMAADATGLLDHLDIARAHIVGASMGGMIAQKIAILSPDRVASLTSIMSTTGNRRVGAASMRLWRSMPPLMKGTRETAVDRGVALSRLLSGREFNESAVRELTTKAVNRSFCPEGTARQLAAISVGSDRTPWLRKVTAPTLVVHGRSDPLVNKSGGIATAKAIPGSRLVIFDGMGHNLPAERYAELAAAIRELANRAPVSAPTYSQSGR